MPRTGITRRSFMGRTLALVGSGVLAKDVVLRGILAPRGAMAAGVAKHLVLLRLYGGNDGLNTVIPYGTGAYYDVRPTLAVPAPQVLALDGSVGLHPRMTALKGHYDAGRLAVIQSVGYPNPNLSHFRSEAIWQSGDPTGTTPTGWIGRYLDSLAPGGDPTVRAVDVSYDLEQVFVSDHANVFAFPELEGLAFPTDYDYPGDEARKRAAFDAVSLEARDPGSVAESLATGGYVLSQNVDLYAAIPDGTATYPDTRIGNAFRTVGRMIASASAGDIAAGVYQVGIDGFDTHANQEGEGAHPDLWGRIDAALAAFHADMAARGLSGSVLVLAYSEFGRRVEENGSRGTDHGTAAPMLAFGDPVAGGLYGAPGDLADLDDDGNLKFAVDFREVYATVLERWLAADSTAILDGTFTPVPFLP